MSEIKQYIIIREDLNMSPGKIAAQSIHAAYGYIRSNGFNSELTNYLNGLPIIIVKKVKSKEKLMNVLSAAQKAGIKTGIQIDAGLTEIEPDTVTAISIGPDTVEKCEPIVKRLRNL